MNYKNGENAKGFQPSIKHVMKILNVLFKHGPLGRTELSQKANINYSVLAKHLEWLAAKSFVEIKMRDKKVEVHPTEDGKRFSKYISAFVE